MTLLQLVMFFIGQKKTKFKMNGKFTFKENTN